MKLKVLLITAAVCLVGQIIFSFYYSTTTLSLNDRYNAIQTQLSRLKIDNELLEIKLSTLTSLKNIQNPNLVPIKKHYAF